MNDTTSAVQRTPKLRILINGQLVTTAFQVEVSSNNYYGADHFSVSFALNALSPFNAAFWASAIPIAVEVQVTLDTSLDFVSLVTGSVDNVRVNPVQQVVSIQGRDNSACLIDAPTQETFANRTSSEIVSLLAKRHGLTPNVTATTTLAGRFYENDRESLTLSQYSGTTTEWDLLAYLARHEDYDLFVTGNSLFFQPKSALAPATKVICVWDIVEISMERSLILARDITVTAKSWNSSQGTMFAGSVTGQLGASSDASPLACNYSIIHPNLTSDALQTMAMRRLDEITRHERTIEFSMPGEVGLTPRDTILLSGTNTPFDQAYYVNSIKRSFRTRDGFVQRVRASASSPRSIATVTA